MGNSLPKRSQLPAVFVSHGAPSVALEQGPYQDALRAFGKRHQPEAIVVISAHWDSGAEIRIGSAERNSVMFDFGGFSPRLYELDYAAPGSPDMAGRILALLEHDGFRAQLDPTRRLDHGAWVPLRFMYPGADVPVVPLSLPTAMSPEQLYGVGKALSTLRRDGVMVLGSGGGVHNLRLLDFRNPGAPVYPWAREFDDWFKRTLDAGDLDGLLHYEDRAPHARQAVPTPEHFAPVFVVAGAGSGGAVQHFFEGFEYAGISMRCFAIE